MKIGSVLGLSGGGVGLGLGHGYAYSAVGTVITGSLLLTVAAGVLIVAGVAVAAKKFRKKNEV